MFDVREGSMFAVMILCAAASGCGTGTSEALEAPTSPALAIQAVVVPEVVAEPEPELAALLELEYIASGSLESGSAYAILTIQADRRAEVDQVRLHLEPSEGVSVEEVIGFEWERVGSGAIISLDSDATRPTDIVVEFDMGAVKSGQLDTRLSYVDMAKSRPTRVSGATESRSLWAAQRDGGTLVRVREAYSTHAMNEARELAAAGDFSDAQDVIALARAENLDVAQAMRKSRDLAAVQGELSRLRGELKPRPRRRRRSAPPHVIEIMAMDKI